jgi:hypothetical protein
VVIPDDFGLRLVIYGGYWVVLMTVVIFVWAACRTASLGMLKSSSK